MAQSAILIALDSESAQRPVLASKLDQICSQFQDQDYRVMLVHSAANAVAFASSQADLAAALVSWELGGNDPRSES